MQSPLPCGLALLEGLPRRQRAALLAALVVVGHHDGVLVQQRGLQAAVRADERAGLLAEPGEDGVEHQREQHHGRQPLQVLRRAVGHDLEQLLGADDVGQQRVGR